MTAAPDVAPQKPLQPGAGDAVYGVLPGSAGRRPGPPCVRAAVGPLGQNCDAGLCSQDCPGPNVGSSSPSTWGCSGMKLPTAVCEAPRGHPRPLKGPEVSCWGQMALVWGSLSSVGPSGEGREPQAGAGQVRVFPAPSKGQDLPRCRLVTSCLVCSALSLPHLVST